MTKVLFICTANICRSPAAESIARSRYQSSGHLFASAGFLYDGREAEPDMVDALRSIGVDASEHESRIIDAEGASEAELILTMESRHVQDLVVMSPELFGRTLPLKEAAALLSAKPLSVSDFLQNLDGRDPLAYLDSSWDVEDPYRRSKRKYKKAVIEIAGYVDDVLRGLT